ncbi:MAG: hypothetical protein D6742_10535 [Cyanobacteria bacterium J069]|nr:MAG: hypothetical protein D6742_10535 [Cyanobacteria bacterium J069]
MWDEEATGFEVLMVLNYERNDFARLQEHSLQAVEILRMASPLVTTRMLTSSGSCLAEIGRDMVRAEALLTEAQAQAARIGYETTDLYSGLGCVRMYAGDYDEARVLLHRAYQLAQQEQDHWRECCILIYLARVELETDRPAAALPYSRAIACVAAQMQGQGSEAAVADALTALAQYRLQEPDAALQLEQAIAQLQQVDNKRMLSYVLSSAAQADLDGDRPGLAAQRAEAALAAAQTVNQPSEFAIAWALLLQSWLQLTEQPAAAETVRAFRQQTHNLAQSHQPHIDSAILSRHARAAVDRTKRLIQATPLRS